MVRKYNPDKSKPRRHNVYGLCMCRQCRYGRPWYKGKIEKMKHKWRNSWKGGREFVKGIFTD